LAERARLVAAALALVICACAHPSRPTLDIATTTSVQNSGLLESLLPAYAPALVRVQLAGSGRALKMMGDGAVDLVISHAPDAEAQALAAHPDWVYHKLAFNHFLIVGPPADPAGIRSASDAADAFRRIARTEVTFVSRGDQSGTHERERALWRDAGTTPESSRLLTSGQGMAVTLRQADDRRAYTLSDDATFRQLEKQLELVPLFMSDPRLLNTYAVVYRPTNAIATAFANWLIGGAGRLRIAQYQAGGRRAFTVWPTACPANAPADQPCGADRAEPPP
jgi:tungstate transport system substrate-binding protein